MSRWRILTVIALLVVPVLVLAGVGFYLLWVDYPLYGAWIWIPMTVSMALGWVLAYYWQRQGTLLRPVNFEVCRSLDRPRQSGLEDRRGPAGSRQGLERRQAERPQILRRPSRRNWGWNWRRFTTPRRKTPSVT